MKRIMTWFLAVLTTLFGWSRRRKKEKEAREAHERIVPEGAPDRRAENWVIGLLVAGGLLAVGFITIWGTGSTLQPLPHKTQLLGGAIGLSLACIAAALVIVGKRLVVTEEIEEDYPEPQHPEEQEKVAQIIEESGSRFTRKKLLIAAAGGCGTAVGLATIVPALSFGPFFDVHPFYSTPWRKGLRLVDEQGRPFSAADIHEGTFYNAFPQHTSKDQLGAPILVVRLNLDEIDLPPDRPVDQWAPEGILAYSKICTHAGCAINLYRKPTFPTVEPKPAFVCPCHYSTFDPSDGGHVIFGPAGRDLPQLPLMIDARGGLRANGNFSGPVGPSWWGVRLGKAD